MFGLPTVTAQPQCPRCGSPRTALDARFCQICGAKLIAPDAPADSLLGETLLGRYRVVGVLGEGGMGKVYLGEQPLGESTRRVAIKVLSAARSKDPYVVARFRREAAMIAALEHPNTVRIYDYGEEGGRYFSVMEYVPGGSLAELIARGRLEPARAEKIAWQIAGALDEAHRHGIVHRDLKPENVLLRRGQSGEDVAKVVDFGIARRPPESPGEKPLTATGTVLGTTAFMAPEQFTGEAADPRADVYALALVVYQMLTGELPWRADNVMAWADAHLKQSPAPLRSQPGCELLPERYERAIAHALAKDAANRPGSTRAFLRELTGEETPGATPVEDTTRDTFPAARRRGGGRLGWWLVGGLASIAAGYGIVMAALRWRAAPTPTPVVVTQDAGPRDAGTDTPRDPRRVRAEAALREGHTRVAEGDLERAVAALRRAEAQRVLASREVDALREAIAQRGAQEVARLIGTGSCSKAQSLTRTLATVRAGTPARAQFQTGRRRCRAP